MAAEEVGAGFKPARALMHEEFNPPVPNNTNEMGGSDPLRGQTN
jgi:hypothetical protein